MLWIATQSEKGDIYYYNRVTDEVRWDDPKEYVAMQDQLEDMVKIQQAKTVQTCIRIGLNAMLREYLELWYKTTMPHSSRFFDPESSGKSVDHVRTVSKALDSWMRARDLSIRKTAENFYLQEQLKEQLQATQEAKDEASRYSSELAQCKLELAQCEFQRLSYRTTTTIRSSPPTKRPLPPSSSSLSTLLGNRKAWRP